MAGWYVRRGDKAIGPVDVDKLKESVAAGKLRPTDQLAKDATGPWTEAGKTKLFAQEQSRVLAAAPTQTTAIVPQAKPVPERGAAATRKLPKRTLWTVGLVAVASSVGFLILSTGEPEPVATEPAVSKPVASESIVPEPAATEPIVSEPTNKQAAPFEYRILSEEWHDAFVGKAVTVEAQVADDVAPTVTEADLKALVPTFLEKYNGEPFKVLFYTETPLIQAWGVINYTPQSTVGEDVECSIHKYAFEMGPWYFPDRIDRNTKWHELVWLTLPMVNKIVNGATQFHWEVTNRSANEVYFDSKQRPLGAMKDDMRLSPQTWEISTYDGDVPRFVRLVESSLNNLDYKFSQNIVGKLNSVIGSQEYLNGDEASWTWMVDRLEVSYYHFDRNDMITIMQTKP